MLAVIVALTTLGSGCEYARKVIAKDKLNQGAIRYNQGQNKLAQEFFKDASETDPTNPITWLYLGATLVKDYKKEVDTAKQKEIANQALEVYKKALSLSTNNCQATDNALSYMATIYDDLNNVEEWHKTMENRATNQCTKPELQAQSYYSIGQKYWKCSYDQTTRYQDKTLTATDPFHYRSFEARADYAAEAQADRQKAATCVTKGFENFEKALKLDPEYVDVMYYKGLLYREQQKLTKEDAKRKELDKIAVKIAADASALQKKKEAAAALKREQEQVAPKS